MDGMTLALPACTAPPDPATLPGMASFRVKVGNVRLTCYELPSGRWRFDWKDNGTRRQTSAATKKAIGEKARARARMLSNGNLDLANLDADRRALVEDYLSMDPTWEMNGKLRQWRENGSKLVSESVSDFLNVKTANQGASPHNVKTLKSKLKRFTADFGDRDLASITTAELDAWIAALPVAPRTRKGYLGAINTLFAHFHRKRLIPDNPATACERPILPKVTPELWTADELAVMLANVSPAYAPWLCFAAFAGLRREELWPDYRSTKTALRWQDCNWREGVIRVPATTAKTGRLRIITILPALEAWLSVLAPDYRQRKGAICSGRRPEKAQGDVPAETARLGSLVGSWKRNALRKSWISAMCAIHGAALTAEQAGNSPGAIAASYRQAMTTADAERYLNTTPDREEMTA